MRLEIIWISQLVLCRLLQADLKKYEFCSASCRSIPIAKAVDAGIIDELVDESDFEARVMEKAIDLATLGHPITKKQKMHILLMM